VNEIYYVYPRFKNVSFSNISKQHIKYLNEKVKIQQIDEDVLGHLMWLRPRNILLHPVLYVTIGDRPSQFEERNERLRKLLKVKGKLGGFETADSDKISRIAMDNLNKIDMCFLPSKWAIEVFKKSGAKIPLHHLPHGLSSEIISPDKTITNESVQRIVKMKKKHDATMVLYFLLHSEYRKGADIVLDAFKFLQQKNPNMFLVVKGSITNSPVGKKLKKLKIIEIPTWMPDAVLRQLYDACDMLVVCSRGGGFELNALEGLARGLPTLVSNDGCFKDYSEYAIPLAITGHPIVFPDNPIHQGRGWETDGDHLSEVVDSVASNIDAWKEKAEENSEFIKKKYSWKTICNDLFEHLVRYGFCDGK
jgi:glycosyltransferase involved in cell wall biosynthesis